MKTIFVLFSLTILLTAGCTKSHQHGGESKGHEHHEKAQAKYSCPMHPQITSTQEGQSCPICSMDLVLLPQPEDSTKPSNKHSHHENVQAKYSCPMHPEITSTQEGQSCSICGMDLVLTSPPEESMKKSEGKKLPVGHVSINLNLEKNNS